MSKQVPSLSSVHPLSRRRRCQPLPVRREEEAEAMASPRGSGERESQPWRFALAVLGTSPNSVDGPMYVRTWPGVWAGFEPLARTFRDPADHPALFYPSNLFMPHVALFGA